jgi:hypothetical protein
MSFRPLYIGETGPGLASAAVSHAQGRSSRSLIFFGTVAYPANQGVPSVRSDS